MWGRKWLVDFTAGRTQLVLLDQSKDTGAIHVKMSGSILEEKVIFEDAGVDFLFKIGLGLLHYLYC